MRRRSVRFWAAVVVVPALMVGACGDGNGNSGSGGSGGGDQAAPTQAQAGAALLTTADLPAGWQGGPSEDEKNDEGDTDFCEEFSPDNEVEPAAEADAKFAAGQTGPFVVHAVALYEDKDRAERAMDLVREGLEKCGQFTDTREGVGDLNGSLTRADPPDLGDEALGVRMTASGGRVSMAGDIVVVRHGRAVFMLVQFGFRMPGIGGREADAALTAQLAEKAAAKLEAAA